VKHTITSKREINQLFAEARRSTQKTVIVISSTELPTYNSMGRVAYVAGRRLGSAPKRNRAKRILREAAAREGAPWNGRRVILIAREGLFHSRFASICRDIVTGLEQLEKHESVQ
jgi:ribonuclease P protein component